MCVYYMTGAPEGSQKAVLLISRKTWPPGGRVKVYFFLCIYRENLKNLSSFIDISKSMATREQG